MQISPQCLSFPLLKLDKWSKSGVPQLALHNIHHIGSELVHFKGTQARGEYLPLTRVRLELE